MGFGFWEKKKKQRQPRGEFFFKGWGTHTHGENRRGGWGERNSSAGQQGGKWAVGVEGILLLAPVLFCEEREKERLTEFPKSGYCGTGGGGELKSKKMEVGEVLQAARWRIGSKLSDKRIASCSGVFREFVHSSAVFV